MIRSSTWSPGENVQVRAALCALDERGLFAATRSIYRIPSLAAWRAAELMVLRKCEYSRPILELGCGNGSFASLLFHSVDCAVDLNPREISACSKRAHPYKQLAVMDAKALGFPCASFQTIFANCVIEHIPGVDHLLSECRRVLRPGGRLITTVPLRSMEAHLMLSSRWYARRRARDLCHVNLLSREEWVDAFQKAGFVDVRVTPYLPARLCRRWDCVDAVICLGHHRYRFGVLYRALMCVLPPALGKRLDGLWEAYFLPALQADPAEDPAAVLVEASLP